MIKLNNNIINSNLRDELKYDSFYILYRKIEEEFNNNNNETHKKYYQFIENDYNFFNDKFINDDKYIFYYSYKNKNKYVMCKEYFINGELLQEQYSILFNKLKKDLTNIINVLDNYENNKNYVMDTKNLYYIINMIIDDKNNNLSIIENSIEEILDNFDITSFLKKNNYLKSNY